MYLVRFLIGVFTLQFLVSATSRGQNSENVTYPTLFAVGVGTGLSKSGVETTVEAQSPKIVTMLGTSGREMIGRIFATYSKLTISNMVTNEEGKFEDQNNHLVSAGFMWLVPISGGLSTWYIQAGPTMLFPDKDLRDRSENHALKIVSGIDFPLFLIPHLQTFYIQGSDIEGFRGANKIAGEPNLFNGPSIIVGTRLYY